MSNVMRANVQRLQGKLYARLSVNMKWLMYPLPACAGCVEAPCCKGAATGKVKCKHLFGARCTRYNTRPMGCQLYPFYIDDNSTLTLCSSALWLTCLPCNPDADRLPAWQAHRASLTACLGERVVAGIERWDADSKGIKALSSNDLLPVLYMAWPDFQAVASCGGNRVVTMGGTGVCSNVL